VWGLPVWKAEAFFVMFVFRLLAREFYGRERGAAGGEENGPVLRSIEGWEEGFVI